MAVGLRLTTSSGAYVRMARERGHDRHALDNEDASSLRPLANHRLWQASSVKAVQFTPPVSPSPS